MTPDQVQQVEEWLEDGGETHARPKALPAATLEAYLRAELRRVEQDWDDSEWRALQLVGGLYGVGSSAEARAAIDRLTTSTHCWVFCMSLARPAAAAGDEVGCRAALVRSEALIGPTLLESLTDDIAPEDHYLAELAGAVLDLLGDVVWGARLLQDGVDALWEWHEGATLRGLLSVAVALPPDRATHIFRSVATRLKEVAPAADEASWPKRAFSFQDPDDAWIELADLTRQFMPELLPEMEADHQAWNAARSELDAEA